ncbi:MAG: hypothetical protein V1775_09710 [Bacteroidota bacterium]
MNRDGYLFRIIFTCFSLASLLLTFSCKKDGVNSENHLPVASYSLAPSRGDVNTAILFNAGSVSDFEDQVSSLEVRWDWNQDNIFDTPYSTEKVATYQYESIGVYFPMLEVRDSKGMTDTTRKMVVIVSDLSNQPPDRPTYLTPPEWQTWMDQTIIFKWTCSDPENDPLSFDIWIGKSINSLQIARSGITTFNVVDGEVQYETTLSGFRFDQDYYWQIGAKDPVGNYTVGWTWKFTTRPSNGG